MSGARLFVALELPAAARGEIEAWQTRELAGRVDLRPVASEALHVTLCFLGTRDEAEIPAIATLCRVTAGSPAPRLRPGELFWLPPRRPRVLALELIDLDATLGALQARLTQALADGGFYDPPGRAFLAHLTLARTRPHRPREGGDILPAPEPAAFRAGPVMLMRSHPEQSGARYEQLATAALAGG